MKKNLIVAVTAASLVVGLAACGSHSTPAAQPIGADKNCAELARPADPHGLIGHEWPWPACDALSDVQPGVGQQRAAEIVYDARQRVAAAKREISLLAAQGNQLASIVTNSDAIVTDYRGRIENVRGRVADDLMRSSLALKGTPPEGFALGYVKGEAVHSASPIWTGQGR